MSRKPDHFDIIYTQGILYYALNVQHRKSELKTIKITFIK